MKGYILLADGMKLEGTLVGPPKTAIGWLAANTAVVGFQEMATDSAYKHSILAFTYPEIGNVGIAEAFSESSSVQVAGLVVKVLSQYRSHYLSEDDFSNLLARHEVPCLVGIDTRALAVHLRDKGEMAAAIAPADANVREIEKALTSLPRPQFQPTEAPRAAAGQAGVRVAVINLGVRRSQLRQLSLCCTPEVFSHESSVAQILDSDPAGVFVSDGPGGVVPPQETTETIAALVGQVPVFACGLGNVALGMALDCSPTFLKRGHHGANCPVRNTADGKVEVTQQRHTVTLDRASVTDSPRAELLWENMNDLSVEGIRSADGSAAGVQSILAPPGPGLVNEHIRRFVEELPAN